MKNFITVIGKLIGKALYNTFVAILMVAFIGGGIAAFANYTATQGSGTTFGSIVVSTVHYIQTLLCDPSTPSQCVAVSSGGAATVAGTVTANAGTNLNTSALATSANLTAGTAKAQIVDGSGNVIASTSNALNVNVNNANSNGQAVMASSSPVVIASNQSSVPVTPLSTTNAGAATVKGGVGIVNGGSTYQHVAASQTAAVLQTSTGAAGDYLSHCVIYPSTTAAGSVTVFDNANAAGTNVIEFSTGTLSNLAPIAIPVGAVSTAGAWKVTTGANETVVCYGKFS
jgi:hypothetical protein